MTIINGTTMRYGFRNYLLHGACQVFWEIVPSEIEGETEKMSVFSQALTERLVQVWRIWYRKKKE